MDTICETPQQSSSSCLDNSRFLSAEPFQSTPPAVPTTPLTVVSASQEADFATKTELERSLESMATRLLEADIKCQQVERKRALEVDFWRARYISVEMERAEIKKRQVALNVKLGQLIQMDQKLNARDVASYETRILTLEEEVNGLRRSEGLANSDAPDLPNGAILDIGLGMERIDGRLRRLFEGEELYTCPSVLNAPENSQLRTLCAKVLNVDLADAIMLDVPEFSSERRSRQTLLRALSAAALDEWVFQGANRDVLFDRYDGDSICGLTSRYGRALRHVESRGELTRSPVIERSAY